MTWVKICGMTTEQAVGATVDGGADAMGFVLAPGSPRTLSAERARDLVEDVPIATFIVTVDLSPGEAIAAAEYVGATGIQAHGSRSLDVAAEAIEAGYLCITPVPVGPEGPIIDVSEVPESSLPLYDTASRIRHGGTGNPFDWDLITARDRPFILAGGLGPDNVQEAIKAVHPFGVDASSRLEAEPGVKDTYKIVDFIEQAKQQ